MHRTDTVDPPPGQKYRLPASLIITGMIGLRQSDPALCLILATCEPACLVL